MPSTTITATLVIRNRTMRFMVLRNDLVGDAAMMGAARPI
jgi:hypothetical protein